MSVASGPPDTKSGRRDESWVPRARASALGLRPCTPRARETRGAHSPGERGWGGAAGPAPPSHVRRARARSPLVGQRRRKARCLPGCAPGSRQVGTRGGRGPATVGAAGSWGEPRDTPPLSPRLPGPAPARVPCPPFASGYGTLGSVSLTCWPLFSVTPEGGGGRREVTLKERVPRESSSSTKPLKTRSYSRCRFRSVRGPRNEFAAFWPLC